MKLTQNALAKIKHDAAEKGKSDYTVWDDAVPGFGLRFRDGRYNWVFQYKFGGAHWRVKIGTYPPLNCDGARSRALALKGQVEDAKYGRAVHPAAEREKIKAESQPKPKAPRANSLASVIPAYLEARLGGLKDSTHDAQTRHLNDHWKSLHSLPLANITRADVAVSLNEISKRGPVAANRARATLSKFFRWAIGEGICDANPVVGTNKRDPNDPRERSLSDTETAKVWLAVPDNDYGRIVKLLLLTGCRRTEIGDLKWSEIDFEARTMTIPGERTKNGEQHVVPLSNTALEIVRTIERRDRDYVFGRTRAGGFSGWSKSKKELDAGLKLKEKWTLHDLRRTCATHMGEIGVEPHIIEAVLNHISGHKAGVAGIYNLAKYEPAKRDALNKWAAHLKVAVAQATGANVTTLRKRDARKPRR